MTLEIFLPDESSTAQGRFISRTENWMVNFWIGGWQCLSRDRGNVYLDGESLFIVRVLFLGPDVFMFVMLYCRDRIMFHRIRYGVL